MCFSSSRLPVCLTSMSVIYTGEATKTRPSQCVHPSSQEGHHGDEHEPSGQIVSMIACTRTRIAYEPAARS
jgi:hypothetical protein